MSSLRVKSSKKEDKVRAYLDEFGKKHNLTTVTDKAGNVLITKPATPGYENEKTIILQAHMDMVCEKNSDVEHNFDTDPIQVIVDNGWIKAKGTTLKRVTFNSFEYLLQRFFAFMSSSIKVLKSKLL